VPGGVACARVSPSGPVQPEDILSSLRKWQKRGQSPHCESRACFNDTVVAALCPSAPSVGLSSAARSAWHTHNSHHVFLIERKESHARVDWINRAWGRTSLISVTLSRGPDTNGSPIDAAAARTSSLYSCHIPAPGTQMRHRSGWT
jgi:hypothetical protein